MIILPVPAQVLYSNEPIVADIQGISHEVVRAEC